MEELDGVPQTVLGHQIKTRTQITLTCLVPTTLELFTYITVIVADLGVVVAHFKDSNNIYASLTLALICLPAIGCFCSIVVSPWQWPSDQAVCDRENSRFFGRQTFNLIFFPVGAVYRFARRIFWSIEALFYDRDSYERHHSTEKAAETSPFELYHFLQAYLQSAPQIILQLFILMRENEFRNYETTTAQVVSVTFSLIQLATITMSFQRFESQKVVGRHYPWATSQQICTRRNHLQRSLSSPDDVKSQSSTQLMTPTEFPETEHVMRNFKRKFFPNEEARQSAEVGHVKRTQSLSPVSVTKLVSFNITDDEKLDGRKSSDTSSIASPISTKRISKISEVPDDDTLAHINEIQEYVSAVDGSQGPTVSPRVTTVNFDVVPDAPAPPTPPTVGPMKRLSMLKSRVMSNAEHYLKDHVPRLPSALFPHDEVDHIAKANDEVDLVLPTRRSMVVGLEQEDFVAKSVSFTGWVLFLLTRMIALSTFAVFFPEECFYVACGHYLVMFVCLCYETKLHEKIERTYFYLFLSYVYIFSILEFKIKFIHVRKWYVGYILLVTVQNLVISLIWYLGSEFESWWFEFMFNVIMVGSFYAIACFLFYYFRLKPADKILFKNET